MKIGTKERLATIITLATIVFIGLAVWRTYAEVEDANRQRREAAEIAQGLTELRLVTFDYALHHHDRARAQWHGVSARIDRAIATSQFPGQAQQEIVTGLSGRRALARGIFGELTSAAAADPAPAPTASSARLFEDQLLRRLMILQQDSFADAFRLTDLASERITDAQQRVALMVLVGLALIAAMTIGASWIMNRGVLAPIVRLRKAAHRVASGERTFEFGRRGDDEIGQLAQSLSSMTQSLQHSLSRVERSNQELSALNNEMEAFSYSVSHDLRAPLRSMDGFSLALMQDYGDKLDAEGKDFLTRIRAASQRMGRLIDDLLVLSRVTRAELNFKPVDLSAMAREIAASLRSDQPGRSVTWRIEDNVTVRADKSLMGRAMQNLLENAWKFTARTEGATIHVGTQVRDGGKVVLVADNGVGFDMAHADRLFGAFQRLHHADDFPGTGIGLAIVQRIVRRHEGRIWAQAREGQGATFFFTLGDLGNETHRQDHPAG